MPFGTIAGISAILGGGASLGSSLLGNLLNYNSAQEANRTAREIASANRKWMEKMSNTAHQREVSDLRAAGLNPILSATGGAGSPAPSADTSVQQNVPRFDFSGMGNSVSSSLSSAREIANIDLIHKQTENVNAQTTAQELDNQSKSIDLAYRDLEKSLGVEKAHQLIDHLREQIAALRIENVYNSLPDVFSARVEKASRDSAPGRVSGGAFGIKGELPAWMITPRSTSFELRDYVNNHAEMIPSYRYFRNKSVEVRRVR